MVRRRWVAAAASVLALGVLIVAFSQIKIGLAGSESLATKGPAFVALSTLEKGGEPTGTFTPLQVLTKVDNAKSVAADLAKVDGITDVIVATDPGNVRNGRTVVIAIPSQETVNSKSVGPSRARVRLRTATTRSSESPAPVPTRSTSCTPSTASSR